MSERIARGIFDSRQGQVAEDWRGDHPKLDLIRVPVRTERRSKAGSTN